jgi:hypothetical protein
MIDPVREVSLPYPCDSIREGETQSQESGVAGVQELQESGGQEPRPEGRPHSATPELLQLLTPELSVFESVEVLTSKR